MWPINKSSITFCIYYLIFFAIIVLAFFSLNADLSRKPKFDFDSDGKLAILGEVPYYASIQANGTHVCSGSLVSKKFVLTTGTCLADDYIHPNPTITVVVGTIELPGGNTYGVKKVNIDRHNSFDYSTLKDDIALMRLDQEIVESRYLRSVKLTSHELKIGQKLVAIGFKPAHADKSKSRKLKKLTVYVAARNKCTQYFPDTDMSNKFCAFVAAGFDGCQFEVGDQLTINKQYLVGIFTSLSRDTCGEHRPILVTSVMDYLSFINSKI